MARSPGLRRRLAAGIAALCLGAGLATATAGAAQAAVPNHWGFAYVNHPKLAGIPVLSHQAGSWSSGHVHVTPGATGQVRVIFPHIASPVGAGVVHVTAVTKKPIWCQAQRWGPSGANEIVWVRCYASPGKAVFAPFTVVFTTSSKGPFSGGAYGYVHWQPGPGIVATFNSTGSANTVAPGPTGVWVVALHGLSTSKTRTGGVQVTAVNAKTPAKCDVSDWVPNAAEQLFVVRCYGGQAQPLTTGWNLSYQRGRAITATRPHLFAYTLDTKPLIVGPYLPPLPVSFNSASGLNNIRGIGAGRRLVEFPKQARLPNTVLVTPYGAHGAGVFCNLTTVWVTPSAPPKTVRVKAACYTPGGLRKNHASLITYTTAG